MVKYKFNIFSTFYEIEYSNSYVYIYIYIYILCSILNQGFHYILPDNSASYRDNLYFIFVFFFFFQMFVAQDTFMENQNSMICLKFIHILPVHIGRNKNIYISFWPGKQFGICEDLVHVFDIFARCFSLEQNFLCLFSSLGGPNRMICTDKCGHTQCSRMNYGRGNINCGNSGICEKIMEETIWVPDYILNTSIFVNEQNRGRDK